jgi:hypothetical protein
MANFQYEFSVTGDCTNNGSGAINISLSGGVEPYTIDWVNPNIGTGNYKTGLNAGVYIVRANDSLGDVNNEFYINIIVSSGGCLSVSSVSATTCGQNNGVVTISGASTAYPITVNIYSGSTLIQSAITTTGDVSFINLAPGVYRTYYEDYGGCSGYSESVIVNSSTPVDYGFFIVNDTNCFGATGKLQITGLTGSVPFTYLWSDGSTGTTITGLTASTYSVTVTDSEGCSVTKAVEVKKADPLQIVSFQTVSPSCFAADGSVNLIITGGTGPFFYSGTNGTTLISYATNLTFTGFTPGTAIFTVTDSTLCSVTGSTYLQADSGFSVLSISTQNSTCSASGGTISINVVGNGPFTYTLVKPDSSTESFTTNLTTQNYNDLDSGDYTVIITNTNGCVFTQEVTLYTTDKFSLTTILSGTTCGQNNGSCQLQVGTGYTGVLDMILTKNNVPVIQYIDVPQSAVTFNGLSSGSYTLQVRDADNCSVYQSFSIGASNSLDFGMSSTSCGNTNSGGTINVSIFSGTPPFTYQWSDNVPITESGPSISNLTGGTYSLTVLDSSGCSQTRTTIIDCDKTYVSYQSYVMGAEQFSLVSPTKRGILQMLTEGFDDLTSGNTNCDLVSAEYYAKVQIQPIGIVLEELFFTGTSLIQTPSDSLWYSTIDSMLESIYGIGNVTVNQLTNEITIETDRSETSLNGQEVIIELIIVYDIMCLT